MILHKELQMKEENGRSKVSTREEESGIKSLSVQGYTKEINYTETVAPMNEFEITGRAQLSLWGGSSGSIEMERTRFDTTDGVLTEDVIKCNLNDGGFGAEKVISAKVFVFQRVEVTRIDWNGDVKECKEWMQVFGGKNGKVVKT